MRIVPPQDVYSGCFGAQPDDPRGVGASPGAFDQGRILGAQPFCQADT
jgi:hypothetical protein